MKNIFLLLFFVIGFFKTGFSQPYVLDWATYFGDNSLEITGTVYTRGNIFIVGNANDNSPNIQQVINEQSFQAVFGGGNSDGFIAKFSTEGQLMWFTYYGGAGNDKIHNITTDGNNIYVAGTTTSSDMATPAAYQTSINGTSDGFIASFDDNGNLFWHTYFGGEKTDSIYSVTHHDNNLYLYGATKSHNNIATTEAFQETIAMDGTDEDYTNNFIAKFSNTGQRIWATYYGIASATTSLKSYISGISVNESGLYIAGWDTGNVQSTDNAYFGTAGAFLEIRPNAGVGTSLYLSKFSFDGNRLWSTYFSGYNASGSPVSIIPTFNGTEINVSKNVIANANGVYLSGNAIGTNGIGTEESFQPTKAGVSTFFVTHFSDTGERLWGSYLGNNPGGTNESGRTNYLTSDAVGNIYMSGGTGNVVDISTTDGYQPQKNGAGDLYVAKISADGTTKIYGTYYGGSDSENYGHTIPLGDGSAFYLIGMSNSSGLATNGAFQEEVLGSESLLIAKFKVEDLSIQDLYKNNIVLYPNPNNGSFIVSSENSLENVTIQIFDMQGRKVYLQNVANLRLLNLSLNLPLGVYLLKLTTENKTISTNKIIIKN